MTETLQGRDGSPSVAALAIHLSGLRRDLGLLAVRVDAITITQQEHAAMLVDIAELKHQVEQISDILTEDDASPSEWFWLTMTDQQREEHLAELTDWVETVLRAQYPAYLTGQIRTCWPHHPEAKWELAWLYQLWSRAYLASRTDPRAAADWHDRWTPGVLHRLNAVMRQCTDGCQQEALPNGAR